jgi:S1-C subfamily serine protease
MMKIASVSSLLLVVSLGAAIAVGCGSDRSSTGTRGEKGSSPEADPAAAMVWIKTKTARGARTGTGFIWDADRGLILTSLRAVEGATEEPTVVTQRGTERGHVKARGECHDVALMQLHPIPAGLTDIDLASASGVRLGDKVHTLAYAVRSARGSTPRLAQTSGSVVATEAKVKLSHLLPSISPLIAHNAPVTAAYEGGPLLDERNEAIGVNVMHVAANGIGALPNAQYALQTDWLSAQIEHNLTESPNAEDPHEVTWHGWEREHLRCHGRVASWLGLPLSEHTMGEDSHGHEDRPGHMK